MRCPAARCATVACGAVARRSSPWPRATTLRSSVSFRATDWFVDDRDAARIRVVAPELDEVS